MKLSIAVLAYNEENNIVPFLDDCLDYLNSLEGEHEILVIDDGSNDTTADKASRVADHDRRVRVISHSENLGMGAGMRTGYENARGDYLVVLAGDGQVRAWEIDKLLPCLDIAPIVLSVYSHRANSLIRLGLSLGFRALMRALIGLSFNLEGIYLFPVKVAREEIGLEKITSNTFFFSFELISRALALGYHAHTVSIDPLPRQSGRSKVANLKRIYRVASEVIQFRMRLRKESM